MKLKWKNTIRITTLWGVAPGGSETMLGQIIKISGGFDSFEYTGGPARMLEFQTTKGNAKTMLLRAVKAGIKDL